MISLTVKTSNVVYSRFSAYFYFQETTPHIVGLVYDVLINRNVRRETLYTSDIQIAALRDVTSLQEPQPNLICRRIPQL